MNSIDLWTPSLNQISSEWSAPQSAILQKAMSELKGGSIENAKMILERIPEEPYAQFLLGMIAIYHEKEVDKGLILLENANYGLSNYILGALYLNGRQVPRDFNKGISCLEKAAGQGHVRAQAELGAIYYFGVGVKSNTKKMITLLSNKKGHNYYRISETLGKIKHVSKLAQQAFLETFISSRNPLSEDILSRHLVTFSKEEKLNVLNGLALKCFGNKEFQEANRLWQYACTEGDDSEMGKKVMVNLGRFHYEDEEHYDENASKSAVGLWKRVLESDPKHPHALYYLGMATYAGRGIKQDKEEGERLLHLSAESGFLPATIFLNELKSPKEKETFSSKDVKQEEGFIPFTEKSQKISVYASKSFLNKAWSWIKDNYAEILLVATITTVAIVGFSLLATGIVAGIVASIIYFPKVWIAGLWIVNFIIDPFTTAIFFRHFRVGALF